MVVQKGACEIVHISGHAKDALSTMSCDGGGPQLATSLLGERRLPGEHCGAELLLRGSWVMLDNLPLGGVMVELAGTRLEHGAQHLLGEGLLLAIQ